MQIVVFDLEFNMAMRGYNDPQQMADRLSSEIIEIGAVKLDEQAHELEQFATLVKARYYRRINPFVKKVTHRTNASLKEGLDFPEAIQKFYDWCGDDFILASWSDSDSPPLRQNLEVYGLNQQIPCRIFNVQKAFAPFCPDLQAGQQASLEKALATFEIVPEADQLHSAAYDAHCTALVLAEILRRQTGGEAMRELLRRYSYNPNLHRSGQVTLRWRKTEDPLAVWSKLSCLCPDCHARLTVAETTWTERKAGLFESSLNCPKHGAVRAHLQIKEAKEQTPRFGVLRLQILHDDLAFD